MKLSEILNLLLLADPSFSAIIDDVPSGNIAPKLKRCNINPVTGNATFTTVTIGPNTGPGGADIVLTNSIANPITPNGQFKATKVWGAVWNDYADFQRLNDKLEYGKSYVTTFEGCKIATKRCQKGVVGIASDTFGSSVGQGVHSKEVPLAVSGWVLAFVDKQYESGTPLTNDENGNLTEMTQEEKLNYPERLLAIYDRPEYDKQFGTANLKIETNGRHWVKVK